MQDIKDINKKSDLDVSTFEYNGLSPARFESYYDPINDVCWKINDFKVYKYFNREPGFSKEEFKTPCFFEDYDVNEFER